jgi:RHS repeat-associated protein
VAAGRRRAPQRPRRHGYTALVVAVSAAVVASTLTLAPKLASSIDVEGKSIDMAAESITPMTRPGESDGVKLAAPDEELSDERVDLPATDPKPKCREAIKSDPLTGVEAGDKVCVDRASSQDEAVLEAPPLEAGSKDETVRVPESVEEPDAIGDDVDADDTDEAVPSDPSASPSPVPTDETPQDDGATPDPGTGEGARGPPVTQVEPASFHRVEPIGSTEYRSPNWTRATTPSTLKPQHHGAMAYDQKNGQIVLFGGAQGTGSGATTVNETWTWKAGVWTKRGPATSPPVRSGARMVWDPVQEAVILFGGRNVSTYYNDVWKWTGSTWVAVTPSGTAPTVRGFGAMAYDPVRKGIIVFGGLTTPESSGASVRLNDTWQLKNNTWTRLQANGASGAPAARSQPMLGYSETSSELVLFGGTTSNCGDCARLDDTWTLGSSATSWTSRTPANKPEGRAGAGMAFDRGVDGLVMFGGISGDGTAATYRKDTWAWDGSTWRSAGSIASPGGRQAMAMAATTTGQVVMFGGSTDAGVLSDTWVYDAGLPVLSVSLEKDSASPSPAGVYYAGDSVRIKVSAVNTGVRSIATADGVSLVSALSDSVLAAGTMVKYNGNRIAGCQGVVSTICGGVSDLTASIANIDIPAGGTRVAEFVATLAGTHRGCKIVDVPALVSNVFGGAAQVKQPLTVCGGGLGVEDWWTYDTTDLGSGGSASVNVANGNLVVKQYESTPVQTKGRLALGVGRAYNSQDVMSDRGPLGPGWQFDLGETSEFAGGFGIAGLSLPNLQTLTQPLSMPYIDRDGTRHIFKLRSIGAAAGDIGLALDLSDEDNDLGQQIINLLGGLGTLPFKSTSKAPFTNICLNQAYTGPPGTNMHLFRYVGVGKKNACSNPANAESAGVVIGWSLVRSDRVRYDFDVTGQLLQVTDPTGQKLTYTYGSSFGPTKITTGSCESAAHCHQVNINYDADGPGVKGQTGRRHVKVVDSAGRVTSYVVEKTTVQILKKGANAPTSETQNLLTEVWEPGNPLSTAPGARPSTTYSYANNGTACGDVAQLCSVTDAVGAKTTFTYAQAPLGPQRIATVTDRRGNVTSDGTEKGLRTTYTWDDTTGHVTADMGKPSVSCAGSSACQRIRYSDIDAAGRVGQIAEGTADNVYLRQSGFFWDGGAIPHCATPQPTVNNNLCQTIKRAVPSSAPFKPGVAGTSTLNGVTVHDEAVDYLYGNLGQTLRKKVLLDASKSWTNENSAITTWGSIDQYFDANGDQRQYTNHVLGSGRIGSSQAVPSYAAATLAKDPVSYWRLGESPGTTTMKSETGRNNAQYYSGTTLGVPGAVPDDTAVLEAEDAHGAIAENFTGFAHGTAASTSDFTVETWVKGEKQGQSTSFQWGDNALAYGAVGRLSNGQPFIFLSTNTAIVQWSIAHTTTSVNDGKWHHVVYTYDGSGSTAGMNIWIDGVKQPMSTYADDMVGQYAPADTTAIFASAETADSHLDELAIYDRKLTDSEIRGGTQAGAGGSRLEADTLFAVTDQTQELSPRGNAAAKWGDYLVTTRRDIPEPGQKASTNRPASTEGICGFSAGQSKPRGNTGLVCEQDTPASEGNGRPTTCQSPTANLPGASSSSVATAGAASSCTTFEYNAAGQRTSMWSPKAHALGAQDPKDAKPTQYTYYGSPNVCSDAARTDCDLSGTVSAEGWLKSVVDPQGENVVYAYDAAGNVARTWDRNAAKGKDPNAAWSNAKTPPSTKFTENVASTPVTSDSLSVSNTALITVAPDGTVVGAGANGSGELGDRTTQARSTPVRADGPNTIVQVAQSSTGAFSGCSHTIYRTGGGEVLFSGAGNSTPTKVDGLSDIISVAAGGCHTLALDSKGQLWGFGTNSNGQVGNGSTSAVGAPVKVLDNVSTMSAGYLHSLAVKTDGTLWAWGANGAGQLGLGDTNDRSTPTEVTALRGARSLGAGLTASYAIRRDGTAWSWGDNSAGELGLGDTTRRTTPTRISSLGEGTGAGAPKQIIGSSYGAAALMSNGTVRVWGTNNSGQHGASGDASTTPKAVPGLSNQVALAGGWATWASADAAGTVKVWGSTGNNQLANGTAPSTSTPTTAGVDVSPYRLPGKYERGSRDATGRMTSQNVDRLGNVTSTRSGRGHAMFGSTFDTATAYDAAQRPVRAVTAQNRSTTKAATVEYDSFGNPIKVIDPRGNASRATFDAVDRQLTAEVTRPAAGAPNTCSATAATASWTSGQNGHKICVSSATYDGLDRPITSTDANSQVTRNWLDAASRTIRRDVPRNSDGLTTVISRWRYDVDGNVLTVCTPRQFDTGEPGATTGCAAGGRYSTDVTWDRAGRPSAETAYRGTQALTRSSRYDADGNLVSSTDANGHTTTASFDLLGRRTEQQTPRSSERSYTTKWAYDASGNVLSVAAPGSHNVGSGTDGDLVVDGSTAASSTDGVAHGASNPFKIPDGAQYRNVTLQNGAVVTSADPNGLVFHATGTVAVCSSCSIDMSGKGYKGGPNGSDASNPNSGSTPGNGGLKGTGNALSTGTGGGGGGHVTAGGNGAPSGGVGGLASGEEGFADVGTKYLRGSGGGGGAGGEGLLAAANPGGDGGGYIRITADTLNVQGTITAAGRDGSVSFSNAGNGGGGAGGGIWLTGATVDITDPTKVSVKGGSGGTGDRKGGDGSIGRLRIDVDELKGTAPSNAEVTRTAMVTAYSYDAANRVVDTVEGSRVDQADPTIQGTALAAPDPNGFYNTRSRYVYDADGQIAAMVNPKAFSTAASLTSPNVNATRRVDYDLDARQVAVYTARFDSATTSIGGGNDGGAGANQQTAQCATGRVVDAAPGLAPYGSTAGVCAMRMTYDALGNVSAQRMPTSNGSDNRFVAYTYTPDNLPITVTGPDPNSSGRVTIAASTFDGVGRVRSVVDANGNATLTSYTSDGLPRTDESQAYTVDSTTRQQKTTTTYDANGNAKTVTDGRGKVTRHTWTSDNLLAVISAPGVDDDTPNVTEYGFDNVGNPTSVLMPQQKALGRKPVVNEFTDDNLIAATHTPIVSGSSYRTTRYAYSPAGWKTSTETARCTSGEVSNCRRGNAAWSSAGTMRLNYGANGRVAEEIGRNREAISTTYDQLGSPKRISDPTSDITIKASYYLDGMLRTVDDGRNENSYAYDAAGEPTVRTDKTGSGGVTNGSTLATTYSYNDAGLVSAMSSDVLDETTTYQWDDSGRMVRAETGDHVNEWSYHPDDTIAGAKNSAGGSTKSEYVYRYDNAGNLTTQIVSGAGPRYTDTFAYNPASNLTSWDHTPAQGDTSAGAAAGKTTYAWDKNGNRTSLAKVNSASQTTQTSQTTWSYRDDNSIASRSVDPVVESTADMVEVFAHEYDSAGRLTNDGCNTMGYDAFDRIKTQDQSGAQRCGDGGRSTTYTYDGLDRQRSMAVTGDSVAAANVTTRNVYDGMTTTMVGQTDAVNGANSAPDIVYQLGADGQAMAYEQSGAGAGKAFLDTDGRGNVTTVVGTDDAVQCAAPLDPFGNPVNPAATGGNDVCRSGTAMSATANSLWYRGQARDGSTGSYQLGTRTYDPSDAAFTTPDTYRVAAPPTDLSVTTDPLTANTYTYVNGNPVNMMDPDGHRTLCVEDNGGRCSVTHKDGSVERTDWKVRGDGRPLSRAQLKSSYEFKLRSYRKAEKQAAARATQSFDYKAALIDLGVEASGLGDFQRCFDGDKAACGMAVFNTVGGAITKGLKTAKRVKALVEDVDKANKLRKSAKALAQGYRNAVSRTKAQFKASMAKAKDGLNRPRGKKPSARSEKPARSGGGSSKGSGGHDADVGGGGIVFTHYTDEAGAAGIAGRVPDEVGDVLAVDRLTFGVGGNSFLAGRSGDNFVTDLGADLNDRQLSAIGVMGDKRKFAVQFSQEAAFESGIRPTRSRGNIWTIPGPCEIRGACVVRRVRE